MGMGLLAVLILLVGAVLIGLGMQRVKQPDERYDSGYEWANASLGALLGGYIGSELLAGLSTWGLEIDGLRLFPAIIGAVALAFVADYLFKYESRAHTVA